MWTWRHRDMRTWVHGDIKTWGHGRWRHGDIDMDMAINMETWTFIDTATGIWRHEH
jgi:hypothetical protein